MLVEDGRQEYIQSLDWLADFLYGPLPTWKSWPLSHKLEEVLEKVRKGCENLLLGTFSFPNQGICIVRAILRYNDCSSPPAYLICRVKSEIESRIVNRLNFNILILPEHNWTLDEVSWESETIPLQFVNVDAQFLAGLSISP